MSGLRDAPSHHDCGIDARTEPSERENVVVHGGTPSVDQHGLGQQSSLVSLCHRHVGASVLKRGRPIGQSYLRSNSQVLFFILKTATRILMLVWKQVMRITLMLFWVRCVASISCFRPTASRLRDIKRRATAIVRDRGLDHLYAAPHSFKYY